MYLKPCGDRVQYGSFVPPSSSSTKSPPKSLQFWVLLLLSSAIFLLYLAEIFLSRSIMKEQRFLVDQNKVAESAGYYKNGWENIAVESWKLSQQDPVLLDYLKSEGVGVHEGPPPGSAPAGTNAAPAVPAPAPEPATAKPAATP
jgi:hypothetical protein